MFNTTKTRFIGLALAGVVVLSGGIYATRALAVSGVSAYTSPTQVTSTETAPATGDWRSSMLDMLEDHMGLTGAKAEEFANEMTEHMQGFDEDFDVQGMVDWCTQYGGPGGDGTYSPGMMGDMMDGDDAAYEGWHMMGWESTPDADSTGRGTGTQDAPGSQENRFGSRPGGMMDSTAYSGDSTLRDRGMMDAPATTASGPSDQVSDTPTAPGPQHDAFNPSPAGMMGGGMMGDGMM